MLSNVVIAKDPAGNIKINKGKSKGKVDGIAGTINALAEWMTFRNDAMGELIKMAW
jgi:phage terminase large subunit-like protein